MAQRSVASGMRTFFIILFGQIVSIMGSGLTGFALSVWIFQRDGSATELALSSLFATLPGILISPFAGALVDRWDRRWAMILGDTVAGMSTLWIALLLMGGQLQVWHIYIANAVSSAFGAFQWPAFAASVTLLVPKQQLGRASGMAQLGQAIAQIISPVLAGILVGIIKIQGVILIDFATYLFALLTMLIVRIPRPEVSAEGRAARGSLGREAFFGWTYIRARPGLLGLLLFFAFTNFAIGMVQVLITPLVLSFAAPEELGTVLSIAGFGLMAGSLVMSAWGGPQRRVYGILGFMILQGALLLLGGLRPNVPLVATAAFVFLFSPPIINGCSQAIWQSKIPPDIQGRVFSIRAMIAWSTLPLAYLVAGPLADNVFEPLMATNGPLAGSVGQIIGTGPGRGIGLLFMALGFFTLLVTASGFLYPRLRRVELELPDTVPDDLTTSAVEQSVPAGSQLAMEAGKEGS